MLDRHLHPRIKPLLHQCVRVLDKPGITPDGLTLVGFAIGVLALPFLALGWYLAALVAILLNRLLDGLDGALARRRELTDAGGFLDISLDFLFYALVPFGFILAAPEQNALAGGWLLFAFIGTTHRRSTQTTQTMQGINIPAQTVRSFLCLRLIPPDSKTTYVHNRGYQSDVLLPAQQKRENCCPCR